MSSQNKPTVFFSDDISDATSLESPDRRQAALLHRIPVFPETPTLEGRLNSANNMTPSRPNSVRPKSQHSKTNLENRILIKLANVLPSNQSNEQISNFHETKTSLIKLNNELDEIIHDFRSSSDGNSDMFTFDIWEHVLPNNVNTSNVANDVILSNFSENALRKTMRLRGYYGGYINKLKHSYEKQIKELSMKNEELSSEIQELKLNKFENVTNKNQTTVTQDDNLQVDFNSDINLQEVKDYESNDFVKFAFERLESERKLSLEKLQLLADETMTLQSELKSSRQTIDLLNSEILELKRQNLEKERNYITNLKEVTKMLTQAQQAQDKQVSKEIKKQNLETTQKMNELENAQD